MTCTGKGKILLIAKEVIIQTLSFGICINQSILLKKLALNLFLITFNFSMASALPYQVLMNAATHSHNY